MKSSLPIVWMLVAFLLGAWRLEGLPLLWDEGWTLTVARTWVERDFYGRLLLGEPAPPGLEAAFPITASVALAFSWFGIGVWQGRFVGVVYLLIALALMYHLARRVFNRSIANGTLAVLLFVSPHLALQPLFLARLVLAEIPMLCFLLAGYVFFLNALEKSAWQILPALLFWGLALIAKAQTLPFWFASLTLPLLFTLARRQSRAAIFLTLALSGGWLASRLLVAAQEFVLRGHTLPPLPIVGLYDVTAFVLDPSVRANTLTTLLVVGVPLMVGLLHARREIFSTRDAVAQTRLALWGLAASWLGWFAFFSVGWIRYLFPAAFVGSIFVAAMLYDGSAHFDWRAMRAHAGAALRQRRWDGALGTILLVGIFVPVTLLQLGRAYSVNDSSAVATAQWLNAHTASNAVIESYESELFFLLNRRYHYPPDQTNVEMIRHSWASDSTAPYSYDALAADPDYLVVGTVGRESGLYARALTSNAFRLTQTIGGYQIYARVR